MDSKTPVTLLQEFLMKKGSTPDYELVLNGVGTHNPLFVFRVHGLGKTAEGKGKSKREAKHAAAQELLYLINASERIDVVDQIEEVQSPYADTLKDNAVGALQDFCCMHKISAPIYEQTRDEGLPHAKLFGMRCRVSNLSTMAESRTKKQAKQNASHQMLSKLRECLNNETLSDYTYEKSNREKKMLDEQSVGSVSKVIEQEGRLNNIIPLGTPLDRYDLLLKDDIFPVSEVLKDITGSDEEFFKNIEDPLSMFSLLSEQLELNWKNYELDTKSGNGKLCSIQVDVALNNATFFGRGEDSDKALAAAALSALKWFSVMAI